MDREIPPWQESYRPGLRWDFVPEPTTLNEELDRSLRAYADRVFLQVGDRTISYTAFGHFVERAARGLRALGVGPGWQVALHLPNVPHYPIAFFAALRAGAVVVNLSPLDAERELAQKLELSKARVVISFAGLHGKLPFRPELRLVVAGPDDLSTAAAGVDGSVVPFASLLAERPSGSSWPAASPGDLAVLQFTGGTTGVPKAAMLTQANLTAAMAMFHGWSEAEEETTDLDHRVVAVLPMFHIFALTAILLPALRGGQTIILKPRWDVDDIIDTIMTARPTAFHGVPTMYSALLASPRCPEADFSSLRYGMSGGAPLPVEVRERFARMTGVNLVEGWGMTETCSAGTVTPRRRAKIGSAGVPLPGVRLEIRGLDDPTRLVPAGEKGEICVGGPNITAGYYGDEAANRESFVDGLFRTGDVGFLDPEGYVFLVDRRKDMIISSGYNVYPRLIEEAICEHPSVAEVTVIGVPDDYRGEAGKAFVTLRSGAEPFTLDALRDFLGDKLGRHELPGALEFRAQLPKSSVGKLVKRPLIEEERARRVGVG